MILDDVQYQKNYFTNRNKIKTPQGELWLTVPVLTSGHFDKTIREMQINNNTKWRKKHWKSIEIHYRKAPYFMEYKDYFKSLYKKEWNNLFELLYDNMVFLINLLEIDTRIYIQSELGFNKKKQELILEMCNHFDSDLFIFGKDGRNYANIDFFKENHRKIYFQDYKHPLSYPQLYNKFIPNLSIIDLLFNVGTKKALKIMMRDNVTKKDLIKKYMLENQI